MAEETHTNNKKPWYKTKLGIFIIFIFLPFFTTYWIWKQNWNPKLKYGLIAGLWVIIGIGININSALESNYTKAKEEAVQTNTIQAQQEQQQAAPPVESDTQPSEQAPTATPQPKDAYTVLSEIGKEVTDNSSISVFDNDDGTIDVINNIVLTPEIEWGLDAYTRRWVTDYLSKTYTSGLPIRYALITIAFTGTDRDAVRVGLGVNQAENITQDQWKETNPYDLCNWIKRVSTGENQDDYANSTFAENYKCN